MDENMITTRTSLGLDENNERLTIVEGVLHLIYRKTLLLLVPEDNGRHWIVPNNLRELCNFIYFLQSMEDIAFKKNKDNNGYVLCTDQDFNSQEGLQEEANKRLETLESNLRRLMQYIVSDLLDYSTSNMSEDTRGMAEVLVKLIRDLPDWTLITMNKKIVRDILRYAGQDKSVYKEFYTDQQQKTLLNAARHNFIVSMGDVQYVLGVLSRRSNDYTIKKLTEYIRVIWSIKMTMEFYCVGVKFNHNERKKELYEKNDGNPEEGYNYITTHFRDTVGGMMFNPDGDTQFIKFNAQANGITVNKNWIILNYKQDNYAFENLAKQKPNDEEKVDVESAYKILKNTQQTDCNALGCITVFTAEDGIYVYDRTKGWINNAVEGACKWRTLSSGQYYRENQSLAGVKTICLNYFSLFTNLLSPNLIGFDVEKKDFCDWQKNNILAFPFYSMDWMNRFFIELKQKCRKDSETDNIEQAISQLNKSLESTIQKMETVTQAYVKHFPGQKLIGNDFKTRFEAIIYAKDCNDPNQYDENTKSDMLNRLTASLSEIFNIAPPQKTPQEIINAYIKSLEKAKIRVNSKDDLISKISFPEANEYYDKELQDQIITDINSFSADINKDAGSLINRIRDAVQESKSFIEGCTCDITDIKKHSGESSGELEINIYSIVQKKVHEKIKELGQEGDNEYAKWLVMGTLELFGEQNNYNKKTSTQEILKDKCNELLTTMSATIISLRRS